jgi:ribonuclease R
VANRRRKTAEFPDKSAVLSFIQESAAKVGKREIARAFGITGAADRMKLKKLIKALADDGAIERGHGRHFHPAGELPPVTVIEISEIDADGELRARPASWRGDEAPPIIHVMQVRRGAKALSVGDRALARLKRLDGAAEGGPERYEARIMKALGGNEGEVVGLFQLVDGQGRIHPADRREKSDYLVSGPDSQGAEPGDVVLAEVLPDRRLGLKQARVREIIGPIGAPATFSAIALKTHGIRSNFPDAVLKAAAAAQPPTLAGRTDLRDIPLITIDPVEARDHDDAVWAAPDKDPANPNGWTVMVAIADVAAYVRPGGDLDREARERGNSTYFPDRVVSMLPEALSSGLCSLVPDEDRACLAVTLWLDAQGNLKRHEFVRGLMRSRARLSYGQIQAARDGQPDDVTAALLEEIIEPLYGAYEAIRRARDKRQPLDLDLPERRVTLGDDGHVESVAPRARLDALRLVEEFMILANVAAGETLEKRRTPCMYRIHDLPGEEKLSALREFLKTLDLKLAKGQIIKPDHFNRILEIGRAHV